MNLCRLFFPRLMLVTLIALTSRCGFAQAQVSGLRQSHMDASAAAPLIVEKIDENHLVSLRGNTPPNARAEFDQGRVAPDLPMSNMVLVLRRGDIRQAAFDAFVAAQYQPSSANYHHWLTPEEVGERFGPAQSDLDTVTQWLQQQSFGITNISKDRLAIRFSGNAALIEKAFHTEIHRLKVDGEDHLSNMSDPQIPSALAPLVVGIQALHNFYPHPLHRMGGRVTRNADTGAWQRVETTKASTPSAAQSKARPMFGTTGGSGSNTYPVEDVTPYDFASIYNVLPLWNASEPIDGTGQNIAIVGSSNINLDDVATFRSSFGLPPNVPKVIIPDSTTDPGACGNPQASTTCFDSQVENTLDVEWAGAIAQNASITLVASSPGKGPDYTGDAVYISSDYIIENRIAPVMNVSYGLCEAFLGTAGNAGYNSLWQTAASEGIAVMVATGDSGSPACDQGQSSTTPYPAQLGWSVSGMASTPYDTAVGGTDFDWGTTAAPYWNSANDANGSSASGYIPEVVWNESCANPIAVTAIQKIAQQTHLGTVTDAESACNFIYNNYLTIESTYGVDLSPYVNVAGGGGGFSSCTTDDADWSTGTVDLSTCAGGYAKPDWQVALTPNDGKREIPDVSFFASDGFLGSAYLICISAPAYGYTCDYSPDSEPIYEEVGGTSVASPIMAGVMALINQKTGVSQGNPNTELYDLAGKQNYDACSSESVKASSSACIFNDVDTGTNAMPCLKGSLDCNLNNPSDALGVLPGFAAGKGYDLATGLGSVNVANLVNGFVGSATAAPAATLNPASVSFDKTTVGKTSPVQTVTVKNTGNAALTVSGVSITGAGAGSFAQTNDCTGSIAVFGFCTIQVSFTPTATGAASASLIVTDNATASSTQTVSLAGSGTPATYPIVTLTPTSIAFPDTTAGTSSPAQTVTIKNTGDADLVITNIGIGGVDPAPFYASGNCSTIAPAATCAIALTFKPTAAGSFSAFVAISDNASGSPHKVTLTGSGLSVPPPPASYALTASAVTISSAGSSGTSTITATPANGFLGTVTLSCSLATAPANANTAANPTCSAATPISITGQTAVTSTLTIGTKAATTSNAALHASADSGLRTIFGAGGIAFAGALLFAVPRRSQRWRSTLGIFIALAALATLSACGGSKSGSGGGSTPHTVPGTTAGVYTFTVSGAGNDTAATKAATTLTVTVN